jgi:hypothetical protein
LRLVGFPICLVYLNELADRDQPWFLQTKLSKPGLKKDFLQDFTRTRKLAVDEISMITVSIWKYEVEILFRGEFRHFLIAKSWSKPNYQVVDILTGLHYQVL